MTAFLRMFFILLLCLMIFHPLLSHACTHVCCMSAGTAATAAAARAASSKADSIAAFMRSQQKAGEVVGQKRPKSGMSDFSAW